MQSINKNRILIGLLLCTLVLSGYISVFNTAGMLPASVNVAAHSSMSGESQSMNGVSHPRPLDYLTADSSLNFYNLTIKQLRWQSAKAGSDLLTAAAAVQMICFICASNLSNQTFSQFNTLKITWFLHKKDSMK